MRGSTHALHLALSWLLSRRTPRPKGGAGGRRGRAVAMLTATAMTMMALLGATGCDSGDPTDIAIAVTVTSLTSTATKLVVSASLDGKAAMQTQNVTADLTRFGVRLPIDTTGALVLTVNAYDASACRVAQGTVNLTVGAPFRFTTMVAMQTLATRECGPPAGPQSCAPATFCWGSPLPSGNTYLGLWANSPSDAWAVGDVGTAVHYDGTSWTKTSTGIAGALRGVWGSAANDVWAVGDGGTILHYDGQIWQPTTSGTAQNLYSVWGDGTSVWAVGQMGTSVRYNTTQKTWGAVSTGISNQLNGVWATSPTSVFAVGNAGVALKFDGSKWMPATTTATTNLNGVGGDANGIYAVGDDGTIQKYNGTSFSSANMMVGLVLSSVWSPTAGQYIAVGSGGTVLRSTGNQWTVDSAATNITLSLRAVRSSSAGTPIWAAGDGGTLLKFASGQWTTATGGNAPTLRSMFGFSASDIWAVGTAGTALHYDGTSWTAKPPGVTQNLNAVWGSSPRNVWAVGDNRTIQIWNGSAWTQRMVQDPMTTDLNGVYGFGDSDIWVVGNSKQSNPVSARALHMVGVSETALLLDNAAFLQAVWGGSSNNLWMIGPKVAINVLTNVGNVTLNSSPLSVQTQSLWGTGATDIWTVGDGGNVLHYDGSQWSGLASPTTQNLHNVWGTSATNAFAVGDGGTVLLFDGTKWNQPESGTRNNLQAVWGSAATNVWVGGAAESLLQSQQM